MNTIRWLDAAALAVDLPEHQLGCGQVGAVVEELSVGVYEVEFSDAESRAYALLPSKAELLMPLRYELARAA